MPSKARVLALAIDAADPALIRQMALTGEMPAMAGFMQGAAAVPTRAPMGVFVSANWPTIFTATLPDRHHYLCWDQITGGTYSYRETSPMEVRGTPFWETLSAAGKHVAVMDVPHTVVRPVNGVMVSEWGCHDRHFGTASWPPELAGELSERHGAHFGTMRNEKRDQFAPCDYRHRAGGERTDEESVALFEDICAGLELKRAASADLLDRGDWDLFLNVLGESHCVGHQLWHLHDPSHPRHDPALAARLDGDPVRSVYRRLDAAVADHLERVGPDDTVYLFFPHGMTAHNDGTHLFDHVLHRLDWGLDDPNGLGRQTRAAAEVARLIPRPVRGHALRAATPLLRARTRESSLEPLPGPQDRRWFLTPNNTVEGGVRLNLAGREPSGRIHPDDRREVLRWLSERLMELVNVDTGGRVITKCVITDDVYKRSPGDAFADLYVQWERSAPVERVWSPAIGTVAVPYEHWRQGDHVRAGLVYARGPGIRTGRRRRTIGTENIAPTICAAVGVPLDGVDGRPIESILPSTAISPSRSRVRDVRAQVGRSLDRSGERRVPRWARRQDPEVRRLRLDLRSTTDVAQSALRRAEEAHQNADFAHSEGTWIKRRIEPLERQAQIAAMTAWLPHADVAPDLLISVVTPTRNRLAALKEAVASVQGQSYEAWELLIVDDGSTDGTPEFLEELDDPRIRTFRAESVGPSRARNVGLDAAHGEVITYLDDDNLYDSNWLKAVAWTFGAMPDTSLCYGVRVFDDEGRALHQTINGRPAMHFVSWDPEALRSYNLADMNVLAHRRCDTRFDEELAYLGDWDLLLQLAKDTTPVELPAVAVYYRTHRDDRITTTLAPEAMTREFEIVRQKVEADAPA
jgi:predicted AlkP superfamily phosphohydrolase/phosphomutase